ncbi:hypothetical protein D1AOALGA4SA_4606 [Olavius algarvensis Delta 1 endosymbiont]|nr:hypothetical protein D1AOALGA4SA_4606 [Olavius algarvensis Delta 1 endosymbiont]
MKILRNGFDFYLFRQDLPVFAPLRPGTQDYQDFFSPAARGLWAEGRIILTILLILSHYFLLK